MAFKAGRVAVLGAAGLGVAALIAGTGLTARAASDPSIVMGSTGTISARVSVDVPVQITCASGEVGVFTNFSVSQATGTTTTTAYGGTKQALVCDGTAHTYDAVATVSGGSAPLHGGQAVASLGVTVGTCMFFNPDGSCAFTGNYHSASTGPTVIRLVN